MAFGRLRRLVSGEAKGAHFAEALFMGPLAAVAILALRGMHLVARTPIWLIPLILVGGQLITTATGLWWDKCQNRLRLHVRIASQAIVVTATIYATGWGPALAIGLVLVGQESLAVTGSSSQRVVLGWTMSCLATGELLIALGWVPSLIPVPEVHGLAILMGIGIAFAYRSLHSALIEKEEAAALTERRERRFRALVQSSSDLVFAVDQTGAVTYASPSCTNVLGYEPDSLLGSERGMLVHEDDIDSLRSKLGQTVGTSGKSVEFLIRVRHRDRTWRWLEGLATNLLDDPAVAGVVINARDVTERRARLERQAAISDLGREALRATTLAAVVTSATDAITRILRPLECRIVGIFEAGSSEEQPLDEQTEMPHALGRLAESDGPKRLRVPMGEPERPLGYIEISQGAFTTADDEQFVESVSGVVLSATVRFRAEEAIRHQAMHDPLTGLPNRALFNDRLEHALRRRTRASGYVAVMIVDLDGFKNVNDSLGHLAGDALLIAVANRFTTSLRGFDTIARLGGDEFAILVDDLDAADQAGRLAQRVLDALVGPLPLPDQEVAISASVGIAMTDRSDTKADRLLSHADAAMYQAKREGKACYRVFEAAMHAAAVERMSLEQELRIAIRDERLTVHYQPIIDTRTGHVASFEALARWQHPTRGFIPPSTFIPLAEESGLIIDLGQVVMTEACRQVRQWQTGLPERRPSISVNASRLQLAHPVFIEHVTDALDRADLDPSSLIVEVTESILASESRLIIATLNELRGIGVRIAIDDFGTGYSSFAALADLPIDILKIDKRFVDNLVHDDQGRGFVTAIMQLANTLHLATTAEGVEQLEQCDALVGLGCTHIQGYLFSAPMSGQDAHDYLAHSGSAIMAP
ncbi:MAG TPA: EAL domain-containing protein [Acidimicrobiales bacterium]|nr:EAL domain-containing protein [Acidimicrobiales bacterium]